MGTAGKCVPVCAVQLSEYDALGAGEPDFLHLWATLEEELSWALIKYTNTNEN